MSKIIAQCFFFFLGGGGVGVKFCRKIREMRLFQSLIDS